MSKFPLNQSHFELAARFYAATMLSVYGLGKIVGGQFYRKGALPDEVAVTPLSEAGGFDLAWTFFGFSEGYIYFIGLSQLLGCALLIFNKTKLLGVAVLVPILLNIIVVDYFYSISTGAMMSAIGYLTAISFVAFCNRQKVLAAFQSLIFSNATDTPAFSKQALKAGAALLIVVILVLLENQMLNIVGR